MFSRELTPVDFQTRGPSTAKDRSRNVVLVDGTSVLIIISDDDLRPGRRWRVQRQGPRPQ